jgi:hypothetical protein
MLSVLQYAVEVLGVQDILVWWAPAAVARA